MNYETKQVICQVLDLIRRLCQESASFDEAVRDPLVEIHEDARELEEELRYGQGEDR